MKKLLALVLALVMTLGLATVGTNAALSDFSDADQVSNEEAMAVMNAVGVFVGSDGKLDPKGSLTRAAAAKLVAYLALGEDIAEALPKTGSKFADVPDGAWYTGYVNYMVNEGYTTGTGANTFSPNGTLTGYQFGAFLLAVLGYDRNLEGMVGSGWETKVAVKLEELGINDDVDKLGSAALTREEAAQFCLNALKADCVKYEDKGTSIDINGAKITTGAKAASPLTTTNVAKVWNKGTTGMDDTVVQLGEKLYGDKLVFNNKNQTDDFGRPATKWYYSANGDAAGSEDNLVTTTAKSATKTLIVSKAGKTLTYWLETVNSKFKTPTGFAGNGLDKALAADTVLALGDEIEIFVNKDDSKAIDKVIVNRTAIAEVKKVTKVNAEKYDYTVKIGNYTYTSNNLPGFDADTMKADDYVAVIYGADITTVLSVAVPEFVQGKMTSKATTSVTVDGSKYATIGALSKDLDKNDVDYVNTYKFYTVNGYVKAAEKVTDEVTTDGYVYLVEGAAQAYVTNTLGIGGKDALVKVKVAYMDGTQETLNMPITKADADIAASETVKPALGQAKIDKNDYYVTICDIKYEVDASYNKDDESATSELMKVLTTKKFYAYSKNDAGEITFTAADNDKTADIVTVSTIKGGSDAVTTVATGFSANSSTKLVVIDTADKKSAEYVGYKNFPSTAITTKPALVLHADGSSIANTVYVISAVTSDDVSYAYYTGTSYKKYESGAEKTYYTFYVDGASVDYKMTSPTLTEGEIYVLQESSGVWSVKTDLPEAKALVKEVDDNYFVVATGKEAAKAAVAFQYDSKCKVWDVSGDTITEGKVAETDSIVYVADDNGKAKVVFIVEDFVGAQAKTKNDLVDIAASDGRDAYKTMVPMITYGLTQTVDGNTIYLSGKVTDVSASNAIGNALAAWWGSAAANWAAIKDDPYFTAVKDSAKVGFVNVTVDGKMQVYFVALKGGAVVGADGNASKTIVTESGAVVTLDYTGLNF